MVSLHKDYEFTIITPVYNGEKWIVETIKSVLEVCQDFNFEYIVVNDGSTDSTLDILSGYSSKIVVIDQANKGEAESVNVGLRAARGKYILVVSADDPMRSPQLLSSARDIFEHELGIVCVYPSWSVIGENSEILRDVDVEDFSEESLIGRYKCLVGPGGVFRRDAALQILGRRTNLRFTSDYDFWLRLSQLGPFQKIPGYLAFWREHDSSTSIAHRGVEMANERIMVMRKFLSENQHISKRIRRNAISNSYYQAALLIYFDSDVPAKRYLAKALLANPTNLFSFQARILLYIILMPFSKPLLVNLKKIGFFRTLKNNA